MRELAASFYLRLFTSDGSAGANVLLQNIVPLVMADMNQGLMAAFSDDEIEQALFQMGPVGGWMRHMPMDGLSWWE